MPATLAGMANPVRLAGMKCGIEGIVGRDRPARSWRELVSFYLSADS